jgi:hypothetical protein
VLREAGGQGFCVLGAERLSLTGRADLVEARRGRALKRESQLLTWHVRYPVRDSAKGHICASIT